MIDFHSHILPNIDDGSTGMDETINLIIEAKQVGFTDIIATPHYIQGYYEYKNYERVTKCSWHVATTISYRMF